MGVAAIIKPDIVEAGETLTKFQGANNRDQ
jgi:hypothetical protein